MNTEIPPTADSHSSPGDHIQHDKGAGTSALREKDILKTGFVEDLYTLLHHKWVHLANYTLDADSPAGTIFAIIPNHPTMCNQIVRHISQMYGAWTGGMFLRMRFAATALSGASIRVAQIPPTKSEQQIKAMTLQELTTYANVDFDPKSVDWLNFEVIDSRRNHFHRMTDFNPADPDSFGSWIVFFNVTPLVTAMNQTGTITMTIDARGNYDFAEIDFARASNPDVVDIGPIPSGLLQDIATLAGCDDFITNAHDMFIQVATREQSNVAVVGNLFSLGPAKVPHTRISGILEEAHQLWLQDKLTVAASLVLSTDVLEGDNMYHSYVYGHINFKDGKMLALSCEPFSRGLKIVGQMNNFECMTPPPSEGYVRPYPIVYYADEVSAIRNQNNRLEIYYVAAPDTATNWHVFGSKRNIEAPHFTQSDVTLHGTEVSLEKIHASFRNNVYFEMINEAKSESLVYFANTAARTLNTSFLEWSRHFVTSDRTSRDTSYLYRLHLRSTGAFIMYLRLQPNGLWTTNVTSSTIMVPIAGCDMIYVGPLNISQPLPQKGYAPTFKALAKVQKHRSYAGLTRKQKQDDLLSAIEYA